MKLILRCTVGLLAFAMLSACQNVETTDIGSLSNLENSISSVLTESESQAEAVNLTQPQIPSPTSSPAQVTSSSTAAQVASTVPVDEAPPVTEAAPFIREDYWLVSHYTEKEMQEIDPSARDPVDEYHIAQLFSMVLECYHSGDFPNAPHHSGEIPPFGEAVPAGASLPDGSVEFSSLQMADFTGRENGEHWGLPLEGGWTIWMQIKVDVSSEPYSMYAVDAYFTSP